LKQPATIWDSWKDPAFYPAILYGRDTFVRSGQIIWKCEHVDFTYGNAREVE